MNRFGKTAYFWLRFGQVVAVAISLLIASSVLMNHFQQRERSRRNLSGRNKLKLALAKRQTEDYFNEVWLCLRVLSSNPDVQKLSADSYSFLRGIYEANYDQHKIPEIYVIQEDFDGRSRPFMAFERGDEERDTSELHTLEREEQEYAVQVEHIRRFAEDPSLTQLLGAPVPLCVGGQGLVLSVPIRSEGRLMGIVAAMVPSANVSDVLEYSSVQNALYVVNESGDEFGCSDVSPEVPIWFHKRFAPQGVQRFFDGQDDSFRVGRFVADWTRLDIGGNGGWYLASLYDNAAMLAASGLPHFATAFADALLVLLLGAAVVGLCRFILAVHAARRESEQYALELSESDARARAVLDTAAEGIITIDECGLIESFNAAAERIFGYTEEEIIGKNVNVLAALPRGHHHDDFLARYDQTQCPKVLGLTREVEGVRKDGTVFPLDLSCSEVRLPGRRLFTGFVRDITERKRADTALRESEERFRAIACYTFSWENWIAPDGGVQWISPAVEQVTGHSVEACLAMEEYPISLVHPDDRERIAMAMEAARTERTSAEDERFRMHRKDGQVAWCSIAWQPIYNDDEEYVGYRSIIRDITERTLAEESARARLAELSHLGRVGMLNEMTAGLAHELNQPLAAIVNYVHACVAHIRAGAATDAKLSPILDRAAAEAQRAGAIIQHMHSLGRKPEQKQSRVDLNEIVRRAVELVHFEMQARGLCVGCELDPLPLHVFGNAIQLEQVLINLVRNAVEAATNGSGAFESVTIRTFRSDDGEVRCAVVDTGSGLGGGDLDRMFEPFYSTKSHGMGMGLAISRSIVEAHDGRLWAEVNEPRGTILWLALPALDEEEAPHERIAESIHR